MSSTDTSSITSEQGREDIYGDSDNTTDSSTYSVNDELLPYSELSTPLDSQSTITGLNSPMTEMALASQQSTIFFPSQTASVPRKRMGRPCKKHCKFQGNQYTSRNEASVLLEGSSDTAYPRTKRVQYTIPRRGYTSRLAAPFPSRKQKTMFNKSNNTFYETATIPSGMRLLDVSILAEAVKKIRCFTCGMYLTLFESEHLHGWHTTFYIKCQGCHQLLAEFPSSKPMVPDVDKYINVKLPKRAMNEVTMRSVLSVHCSGFSWRDLHKFATILHASTS